MNEIGIVTLDSMGNYGNRLQNYALQLFLEKSCSVRADTLWHSPINEFSVDMSEWPLQRRIRYAFAGSKIKKRIDQCIHHSIRTYRFQQFTQQYIHTKYEYVNLKQSAAGETYDFLVTGSDQVWNPNLFTAAEDMFLLFAPKEKRIAYAASFGTSEIPEKWKKHFAQWLSEMKAISVREQRGAEIVKELTGKTVPVLVDPTMLITVQEWNKIARAPYCLTQESDKKYILLYFLGKIPNQVKENVYRVAQEKNLTIVNLMEDSNINWYLSDPAEFLYIVSHAELIYTDSFHGTVFSILYHRPFVVYEKYEKNSRDSMNSRIVTLLEKFQYMERLVTEETGGILSNLFDMDFTNVDSILEIERRKSVNFMQKALSESKE